jgi:bifunctional DNA-binding transcriptional regulator/antitoxin component of YhaV-PrlF toxin-antitoxin module
MSEGGEEKSFVARVQKEFRIQIPEALRFIMAIAEGDYVEVKIRKVKPPVKEAEKGGEG